MHGHLALVDVGVQGDQMGNQLRQRIAVQSTHGQYTRNNGILVSLRQLGAGQDDLAEKHGRVWTVLSRLGLPSLLAARGDPRRPDDLHVGIQGAVVIREINGFGEDVGVLDDLVYTAAGAEGNVLGTAMTEKVPKLIHVRQ